MKVCPNCGYVDRSMWRQNRWRTNVEFLKYRDYPEDIDLAILKKLQLGHPVALDKLYAYRISGRVVERVLRIDYEIAGMDAFHIPREHVNHTRDPAFASISEWATALKYVRKHSSTKFLIQSKNPGCFIDIDFPDNVLLATTMETNQRDFDTPSKYKRYSQISQAPSPYRRYLAMLTVQHKHKMVTIEPILPFDLTTMIRWSRQINPEIIYVGYDNHTCYLPEPKLEKTLKLIEELRKFTTVRVKSLRRAWWEK